MATNREAKECRGFFTPLVFGHKSSGEGRPRSFHPSVFGHNREGKEGRAPFTPRFSATNREVKEGPGPFTPLSCTQTRKSRKAALLSPLGFGHKPRGEGRPRSFHPSVLATMRELKEGRGPFNFGHKSRGEGKPWSIHPSGLCTNREVKELMEGRTFHLSVFGHKPTCSNAERRFCTEVWSPTTWEFSRELARHAIAVFFFCLSFVLFSDFRPPCFLIRPLVFSDIVRRVF